MLSCARLVTGVEAAPSPPVTIVDGHRLELIRWLDPLSVDCENARLGRPLGLMRAVNVALDRTESRGTRWFKAALECPGDTLPWPSGGLVAVRLESGIVVLSTDLIAAGEGLEFRDYYPGGKRLESGSLHLRPYRDWGRAAWLLIGFPRVPAFQAVEVSSLSVVRRGSVLSRQP
jgi:hypothetical protein